MIEDFRFATRVLLKSPAYSLVALVTLALGIGATATVSGASAGLHLLVWLRGRHGGLIRDVHASAERVGVGLFTVDPFYATPPKRTGILLGFAPLMPADIREGTRRLAGALK